MNGNIIQNKTWSILGDGTVQNPGLSFFSGKTTGFSRDVSNINVSIQGVGLAQLRQHNVDISGNLVATSYIGNYTPVLPTMLVSNIQIANSSYVVQDDTALSTENAGYVIINGSHFGPGTTVTVGGTQASAVTFVSPSVLNVHLPAKAAGSYTLEATRADGAVATVPMGVTFSPTPVWSTPATLANVFKNIDFTQTLSATEASGSNITYANTTVLPPGVSLSSSGVLSGVITPDTGNTTVYSFTVNANDLQFQDIPRSFSLTAATSIVTATGGTVTTSGSYKIHTFTSSGSFSLTSNPANKSFEVLLVAGGGGGGARSGGGGGAGGVIYSTAHALAVGSFSIVIGGGGSIAVNGVNSTFSTLTAIGGGYGGTTGSSLGIGANGGSGGGSNYHDGVTSGGTGVSGQGNSGGKASNGSLGGESAYAAGGGGGAGAVGGNATTVNPATAGSGGDGRSITISGTSVYYGGGGGGGCASTAVSAGSGGLGGGGAGSKGVVTATSGTSNTGGGGGGSGFASASDGTPGLGGSGICIIRYVN